MKQNSLEQEKAAPKNWKRKMVAGLVALGLAVALSPLTALASEHEAAVESAAEAPAASGPAEAVAPVESTAPTTPVPSEVAPSAATLAEQVVAQADCSLTIYYCDLVNYDDPTFNDPSGLRLIEKVVVDGLKPGQTFDAWEFVKPIPGYWFFDGWPRNVVISEDNSKNVLQLHYGRNTHASCLVNYYLVRDGRGVQATGDVLTDEVGGMPLAFEKLGAYQIESQPVDFEIDSDVLAASGEGISYLGADRATLKVNADPAKNEVNLIYMESPAATLPDDVPIEIENVPGGAQSPGTGSGSAAGDGSQGGSSEGAGTGSGSGSGATGGAGAGGADSEGSGSGVSGAGFSGSTDSSSGEGHETTINDENSPLAAAEDGVLQLPQTGDGLAGMVAGALVMAVMSLATAMVARRQADNR